MVRVGIDAERAMPLRELRPVGAVDQRDMSQLRHVPAERLVDLRLPCRVREMIVAPDHVGNRHVVVVDDDREHRSVSRPSAENEIVEVLVLPDDPALDRVLDDSLALGLCLQRITGLTPGGASAGSRSRQRPS